MLFLGLSVFSSLPYLGSSVITYITLSGGVSVSVARNSFAVIILETSDPLYSRNCRPRFTSMIGLPSSSGRIAMLNS